MTTILDEIKLAENLISAAERHDTMHLQVYPQEYSKLFDEIIRSIKLIVHPKNKKMIFKTTLTIWDYIRVLVIDNNLSKCFHQIGQSIITFIPVGVFYHPTTGQLSGFIEIIHSNGDFIQEWKRSKVNPFAFFALNMFDHRFASSYSSKKRYQMESVHNIERTSVGFLWTTMDRPGKWLRFGPDNNIQDVVVKDFIFNLLDHAYNPEGKDWVKSTNEELASSLKGNE
jgi:hypothetical protein